MGHNPTVDDECHCPPKSRRMGGALLVRSRVTPHSPELADRILYSPQWEELLMDKTGFAFWLTVTGTLCWAVCFWWMHRISVKQNYLLEKLGEQGKRIEKLSKIEHDLIKEVHPQVNEIKEGMEEMIATAKENQEDSSTESKGKKTR